ncbi:hypothetical protein KKJFFJLC_00007 [Vibrio phage vB_VpaS_PGB]|nr:hypothetical protein HHKILHMN_00029 [Vibrio phage vB_VpaS_PGA]WVH05550.1 hypothetical protein KKJFFJLC_00007 [Vibrio phage vB_VpaS_PGB]
MSKVVANLDNLKALKQRLKSIDQKELQVGWFEGARYDDSTPVAGVAAIQEFGAPSRSIPPRPLFRPTIEDRSKSWSELVAEGTKAMLEGKATYDQVMNGLGLQVVGDVQKTITTESYPELSPITLALRNLRDNGYQVGGKLIGAVAGAIADGETGPGQLGQPSANTTPLNDKGIMIATMTYEVG